MKNSEYNNFDEIQKIKEYQNYEAVQITINTKESNAPKNETLVSEEYGNTRNTKRKSSTSDKGLIKKLLQKVTEATTSLASGIAATATVAIMSVVIFSSILIQAPNIKLLDLVSGYDYVSYNLYIDEMDDSMDYYCVISNNFENYKFELFEGENINNINNLQHNMKYELYVVGISDDQSGHVKYYNTSFYTTTNIRTYKVQWIVEGIVVEEDEIEYGQTPVYNGSTPVKESTNEYNYTFIKWDETKDENGNIQYIAQFESSIRTYKVQWIVEGIVVEEDEIEYGQTPVYNGSTPVKESTNEYNYTFIKWDETKDENGNIQYIAQFESSIRTYKVQWIVEGIVVEEDEIEYGQTPVYNGSTPVKESTNEYNYTFIKWDETKDEKGNIQYNAQFESSIRMYKVQWIVEGIVVEEDEIEYGQTPVYNGSTPVKEMTVDEEYEFIGWDKDVVDVIEDVTYTAQFNTISHEYTATYNKINASDVIINYDNPDYYVMTFNTEFDNSSDSRLSYRIILTDVSNNETYIYEGCDSLVNINVPINAISLSITYESVGTYNGNEKVFDTSVATDLLEISVITVEINDNLTLINTDEYQTTLRINSNYADDEVYNSLTLIITYNDSSNKEIIIEDVVANEEIVINIPVPASCSTFTIDYTVDLLGTNGHNSRVISGNKQFILENSFELLRVYVDSSEFYNVRFLFKYHFINNETTLSIKDVSSSNITVKDEGLDYIEVQLDTSLGEQEYTYYLSDTTGNALDTETSVIVNTSSQSGVYTFDYVNPGDAIVTFNDDQTMNVYLNTKFETEDTSIWYLIRYTRSSTDEVYDIKYTESIAYLEHIPYDNYYIVYYVYKTIDGIDYQLETINVSGGIEITYDNICYAELQDDGLGNVNAYISYSNYSNVNQDSFVLIIDGIEHKIPSSSIVLNEYEYEINYPIDGEVNEIILEYEATYNKTYMYELIVAGRTIKGQQYRKMYYTIL